MEIAYSLGDVPAALMRKARKPLDPWQEDSANLLMSVRPDDKWACFEYAEWVARQNGKGGTLEGRSLSGLLVLDEELIMWSAHEYKTAMEAFRRVRGLLYALADWVSDDGNRLVIADEEISPDEIRIKVDNSHGEQGFERLETDQRLKFIARSKGSGRGFSGDLNIIDEAFAYTDEQHDALMPTMSARKNPQIIYTSTPPLDSLSGPVMFSLKRRADQGGDDSLGYRDWGIEGCLDDLKKIDVDDPELQAQANPAPDIRITEETIRRNRRSLSLRGFAREVLCLWPRPPAEGGVIDRSAWADCKDEGSQAEDPVAFAVHAEPDRASCSISMAGKRADGMVHVELVDRRQGIRWTPERLVELNDRWRPCAIVIDAKGHAASLIPDLADLGLHVTDDPQPGTGDIIVLTNTMEMVRASGSITDLVTETKTLRHRGQPELTDAAHAAGRRSLGEAFAFTSTDDTDIAPFVGCGLAAYALSVHWRPNEAPEPFAIWGD